MVQHDSIGCWMICFCIFYEFNQMKLKEVGAKGFYLILYSKALRTLLHSCLSTGM